MYSSSLMQIVEPGSMENGSIMQDIKGIVQAMQRIGRESSGAVVTFLGTVKGLQCFATIAAVYLFIMDRTNWRTRAVTSQLVPYLFLNVPGFLLNIVCSSGLRMLSLLGFFLSTTMLLTYRTQ